MIRVITVDDHPEDPYPRGALPSCHGRLDHGEGNVGGMADAADISPRCHAAVHREVHTVDESRLFRNGHDSSPTRKTYCDFITLR